MIGNNNLVISTWNHARSAHITREIERRNIKMVFTPWFGKHFQNTICQ